MNSSGGESYVRRTHLVNYYIYSFFFSELCQKFQDLPWQQLLNCEITKQQHPTKGYLFSIIRTYYINHNYVNNLKINCEGGAKAFDLIISYEN